MKKILISLLAVGTFAFAQDTRRAVSYEALTISTVAVALTSLNLVLAHGECSGRLETADVRFRLDGTDPTAAEGQLLLANEIITIKGLSNLQRIRFIRDAGVDATLRITCYQ